MFIIYKILVNLTYAVLWPYFIIKRRKAQEEWKQRRAIEPDKYLPRATNTESEQRKKGACLHFHASSVGEVRVLERLVGAIRALKPHLRYMISTYTKTGQALAREQFPDAEVVFFFPLDSFLPLRRFFNHFLPIGVIIVETEIWPYFIDFCRKKGIPLVLANGRLTPQSTKYYKIFRTALSRLFAVYKRFIMQTEADSRRIISIGADPARVMALGNIKHDQNSKVDTKSKRTEVRSRLGLSGDRLLLVAASTRPGEEADICAALKEVSVFPHRLQVLIAPRHLERLDEVKEILVQAGFEYTLYSHFESGHPMQTPVVLMDEMGLLAEIFYGADLAFVGGTLADLGGHNIMEPVLAGVPVLFGPSIQNVKDAAKSVVENNQGRMVNDASELAATINDFNDGTLAFQMISVSGPSIADQTAEIIIRELGL